MISDPPHSDPPATQRLGPRGWIVLAACWLVPVVLAATQQVVRAQSDGLETMGWLDAFVRQLPFWGPLALLTPLLFAFIRRTPFDRPPSTRQIALHGAAALAFVGVYLLLSAIGSVWAEGRAITGTSVLNAIGALAVRTLHFHLFMAAAVMAAGYALENHRRLQVRELQAAELRGQLSEAQLAHLTAQLRPHFLFNTLHSISSLMEEDVGKAQEMIAALSDLLRQTLERAPGQVTTLRRELASARLYLEIEKIRFQDRLEVREQIDPETSSARLPSLLLQTLVENAIRHGIARRQDAGRLEIRARRHRGELLLEVSDDGAGLAAGGAARNGNGVGLRNTRQRLRQLYGDQAHLELLPRRDRTQRAVPGTVARVTLPFVVSEGPSAAPEADA